MRCGPRCTTGMIGLLLLAHAAAPAAQDRIRLEGGTGFAVSLRAKEIPPIPAYVPQTADVSGEAEGLALLAQVNRIWAHVRDTQGSLIWFVGEIRPEPQTRMILWRPDETIRLDTPAGIMAAAEIYTSRGNALPRTPLDRSPPMIPIHPGGISARVDDLLTIYPSGKQLTVIYAGFPRGQWRGRDVTGGCVR